MIKFEKTHLNLGEHTIVPVAFEFRGVSQFTTEVKVTSTTSCGCTTASHVETLKPGETFILTGSFIKTGKVVYTKTVTVVCKAPGIESTKQLTFNVKLI